MKHERQQIREYVQERLKTRTEAGDKVLMNASEDFDQDNLPEIRIYCLSEGSEKQSDSPRTLKKSLNVLIEVTVTGEDQTECQDNLDALCKQVEDTLSIDAYWGDLVSDQWLAATDLTYEGGGSAPIGAAKILYTAQYLTDSPRDLEQEPSATDFDGFDNKWQIGHHGKSPVDSPESGGETIDAEDSIDIS